MNAGFYKEFEDEFRGSRELIKAGLHVYIPFIEPLKIIYPKAVAIDLGCGRGEWLELLKEKGVTAEGVDLDDGMLSDSREAGLSVQKGDALTLLKGMPSESVGIVSALHLIEHISFEELGFLVKECLRVLKPSGILILETPNPENITVGTSSFYLDPTHKRPIPSQLLSFLLSNCGFYRTKLLRLHESEYAASLKNLSLHAVLSGVSPDYAIIAQKHGSDKLLAMNDKAYERQYGVSLEQMSAAYDNRVTNTDEQVRQVKEQVHQEQGKTQQAIEQALQGKEKAQQAIEQAHQGQEKAQQAIEQSEQIKGQVEQIMEQVRQTRELVLQAEGQTQRTSDLLTAVYSSRSWRITSPLRRLADFLKIKRFFSMVPLISLWSVRSFKKIARGLLARTISYVRMRPRLKRLAKSLMVYFPAIRGKLRDITLKDNHTSDISGIHQQSQCDFVSPTEFSSEPSPNTVNTSVNLDKLFSSKALTNISNAIHKGKVE